jgi:uncharacterized coiled-coil protein SlyX
MMPNPMPEDPAAQKAIIEGMGAQMSALTDKLRQLCTEMPEDDGIRLKEQLANF